MTAQACVQNPSFVGFSAERGRKFYLEPQKVNVRVGHQRRNPLAGCVVVAILLLLTISGYALYYSDEASRRIMSALHWIISALHWIIGLGAPVVLTWHIVTRRGTRSPDPRNQAGPIEIGAGA